MGTAQKHEKRNQGSQTESRANNTYAMTSRDNKYKKWRVLSVVVKFYRFKGGRFYYTNGGVNSGHCLSGLRLGT